MNDRGFSTTLAAVNYKDRVCWIVRQVFFGVGPRAEGRPFFADVGAGGRGDIARTLGNSQVI